MPVLIVAQRFKLKYILKAQNERKVSSITFMTSQTGVTVKINEEDDHFNNCELAVFLNSGPKNPQMICHRREQDTAPFHPS